VNGGRLDRCGAEFLRWFWDQALDRLRRSATLTSFTRFAASGGVDTVERRSPMRFLSLAIHYPKAEHHDELIAAMARLGSALATTPGMLQATAAGDQQRIVALSIWESRAAFVAAGPAIAAAIADVPFDRWEARQRELFGLDELAMPQPGA
jgi:quinol monooxygenase YgiN